MMCRRRKSKRVRKIRRVICLTLAAVILLSAYLEFAVKAQLSEAITAEMKALAQRAMNAAAAEYLADDPMIGERLSSLHYSDAGAVTSVTSDPAALNLFKANVAALSQEKVEALAAREGLTVPLGSFSGLALTANWGPQIHLDIAAECTASCTLKSTFESAGVNQTLHRVTLTVKTEIVVYNPFRISPPICTCADFEIARTVIVGAVPSYACGGLWQ